ncbi:profilin-like [Artemia franciscana]|uniref:Profilin n=1 Tax=Artemia franciscana TaxID=6661 RepID=A0AA88I8V9_ARTSF|nr:hypothetical protein QYM36_006297 [Artemia franciscana]
MSGSWQDYIDKQLLAGGFISQGAIIGTDGALWAKSDNLNVAQQELVTLATNYANHEYFQANGLTLAGTRYIFLSASDRVIRGKKMKQGIHCIKTEKAIVIGIYDETHCTPQQAANVVERLGEYLMQYGY